MTQNLSIIVIDSDTDSASKIVGYIKNLGNHAVVDGVASTFEAGFELIHKKRPVVVILEVDGDVDRSIEKIKAVLERFPQTSIFATCADKSSDTILKVIRAGASEYILRPISEPDLDAALQKVGRLWITQPGAQGEKGRIFALFSPKGGVGVTTLATNLAADIHKATKKPTLLVDLDLDAGDVTTFLNLKTSYTISDATLNINRLDESFLNGVIARHKTGIHVLSEPLMVEEATSIPGGDIRKLLTLLKDMFPYIVVDTSNVLDERVMTAIEMSDTTFLVFVMSLPGLKHVQRYMTYFDKTGMRPDRIKLVVNRYIKRGDIRIEDAERVLDHKLFWSLPNDYDAAISALNKGTPVSSYKPRSPLSASIADMTKSILKLNK
ncbi:MAG: AAA family ATPase [Thermodesulfobacteriota bacterium]